MEKKYNIGIMTAGRIYNSKSINGVTVLKIEGAFTKDTVPDIQNICYEVAKQHDTKGILLDFQRVSAIDTSAFACILHFIKAQIGHGVRIGITNLKSQEKALAEILKIDKAIHTFKNESEAIVELSKNKGERMSENKCSCPSGDKNKKTEFETIEIEKISSVCPACEDYAEDQTSKPVTLISCARGCLRGEIARQATNLICSSWLKTKLSGFAWVLLSPKIRVRGV